MSSTPPPSKFRCAVCLASDLNYIDYTYVTVRSIADHISHDHHYEVVILSTGVLEYKKQIFYQLNSDNFLVRFVDMEEYVQQTGIKSFFISRHISMATYFRYFIPEIFSDFDRVLYMDGDVIALDDINKILSYDIDGCLLGVVYDADCFCFSEQRRRYQKDYLHMDWHEYFCAGIILYNIPECLSFDLQKKCFETQARLVDPPLHDQDVLNSVTFGKNRVLPTRWHLMQWIFAYDKHDAFRQHMPERYQDYMNAAQDVALIHFGGGRKPWHQPSQPFADLWWQTAKKTPFYERFLSDLYRHQIKEEIQTGIPKQNGFKRQKLKIRIAIYELLTKLSFGRLKERFHQKQSKLESRLRALKK